MSHETQLDSQREGGATAPVAVHVVSHTHWDREWYLPAARFRQQLVALVDDLLDDPPAPGSSFLLDGQMSVIEDYLAVKPERTFELVALLERGAIEAGPWYVLADELIPSGEALVRNLLAGRQVLGRLGAKAPPVLYCPDSFGHPAALPTLAAGFGLEVIILSRGFGSSRWPSGDAFRWTAPSGEEAYLYHLSKKGYDIGENLPANPAIARERWASICEDIVTRARLGVVLLPNGADHHARQRHLDEALVALEAAAKPHHAMGSSLGAFAKSWVSQAAVATLPVVRGELRDSYGYMWTLQGTFATRAHQKRRNASVERMLTRDAEPWVALARRSHGVNRDALVSFAWKSLLLCHPHDTVCGCSTDEVARAMDVRLDEAETQAAGLRGDALHDLIGHAPDAARERSDAWKAVAVVRNPAARARSGVAVVRLTSFVSDVKVGANASPGAVRAAPATVPALSGIGALQVLSKTLTNERTEAPRHYPDSDIVLATEAAVWVPEVPAYGVRVLAHQSRAKRVAPPNPASVADGVIGNGLLSIGVANDGRVSFTDHRAKRTIADLLVWESRTDLGDLYTPSIRDAKLEPRFRGAKVVHKGSVRAAIETRWSFGPARGGIEARVTLIVDANAPFVRVQVTGANAASDHRLRLGFATELRDAHVWADAMFGPVERTSISVTPAEATMEIPPRTDPLHRYVSAFGPTSGATIFSDGLGEYEIDASGTMFVTLVRSVDELSRNDLPERSGHAGWPTHTPEAQCHGPFGAELAFMVHAARSSAVIDEIERAADDVLLPLTGASLRSALTISPPVHGVALSGTGLACSAVTTSQDGAWMVLRCVNLTDESQRGGWTVGFGITEAQMARLDETYLGSLAGHGNRVEFVAPARAVVTVLIR